MITATSDVTTSSLPGPAPALTPALAYHRLMRRQPSSACWWRPLIGVVVGAGLYVAAVLAVMIAWLIAEESIPAVQWRPTEDLLDPRNPMDLLIGLGVVALLLPAAVLGLRWGGKARGTLHSVRLRVRWRLLFTAAAVLLPVYAVTYVGAFLLYPPENFSWPPATTATVAVYLVVIALAPLQCAAEEYLFRGVAMQAFGTWLSSPWWGILVPVPIFVLAHGYDIVGQLDLAIFSICMGALVWKSGGLELAIVMHTANNLILFLLAPFDTSSLVQGAVDPRALLFTVPWSLGITAGLWLWVSRRYGVSLLAPVTSASRHRRDR